MLDLVNPELIDQVQLLLRRVGIMSEFASTSTKPAT